jgi:hypothetical protein
MVRNQVLLCILPRKSVYAQKLQGWCRTHPTSKVVLRSRKEDCFSTFFVFSDYL